MGQEEILEPFRYVIGLVDLDLAGLAAPSGRMLLCAPVAAGHWTLTAAALAGAVALALACIGRRRTGARPGPGRSRDPE